MSIVRRFLQQFLLFVAIAILVVLPKSGRADDGPVVDAPGAGLSFYLPLDGGFESAVGKNGAPAGKTGNYSFVPGKVGQALREGARGSYLLYHADGNMRGDEGTVSMWVRPQWDNSSDEHFHLFWNMIGNGHFTLYRHAGKSLVFSYLGKGQPEEKLNLLSTSMDDWKTGLWHHIAATWRAGEVRLYVDGELNKEVVDANIILPEVGPSSVFFLGDSYNAGYGIQSGYSGAADTDLDEVRLYTTALDAAAIGVLAGKGPVSDAVVPPAAPLVVVPKTAHPPKIDGNFSFDDWKDAAGFTGLVDLHTGRLTDRQTGILLTYDDTNLYMATFAPMPPGAPLKAAVDVRDGAVYGDDSVEVYLDPDNTRLPGHYFQFIGNSIGAFMDLKYGDPAWNGDWNYKCQVQSNWRGIGQSYWVTELSVPFATLGRKTPVEGEQWAANFARSWYTQQQAFTSWAWTGSKSYGVPARFGTLEFREHAPAFQWTNLRDLASGEPSIEGTARGAAAVQLTASATGSGQKFFSGDLITDPQNPQVWTKQIDLAAQSHDNLKIEAKAGALTLYRAEIPYQVETRSMRVLLSPVPSRDLLVVDIDPLRYRNQWQPGWSMKLRLAAGDKSFGENEITKYSPPLARAQLSLRDVPVGSYILHVRIDDATGKTVATDDEPFTKPLPPVWLNNKIGITDKVLKPWTPIEIGKNQLSTWGRSYSFGANALPQQVTSAAEPLLQAPARLVIDGRPMPAGTAKYDLQSGARVVRSGTSQCGVWNIRWKCNAEYDGMLWYEITLDPGPPGRAAQPATLQSLALELPLRPQTSNLYTTSNGGYGMGGCGGGATPAMWSSSWAQVLWLGNEKAGLCWFAESDEHWNLKQRHDALRVERGAAGTLVRVQFVTQPLAVSGPITYRFGLQATPTRPMPPGWRGWEWASGGNDYLKAGSNEHPTHAIDWWMDASPYISSPLDVKPGAGAVVEVNHKLGVKVIPYQALIALNEKAPDFDYYKAEWLNQPRMDAGGEAGQQTWYVNTKGSFQDYFLYALREMIRNQKWDGMYFDFDQGAVPDMNEFHNSGYVGSDGVRHPTFDILAQREFHKRLWAMLQQELGVDEPIVMVHMSGCVVPPIHSFANVYFDGEQFAFAPKVDDDYTKVLSRDSFRAEFVTSHFGGVPTLLPELNLIQLQWLKTKTEPERTAAHLRFDNAIDTVLLYTLTHGTSFTPSWLDMDYILPLFAAEHAFDLGSAHFVGYWEDSKEVTLTPTNPDVVASLYTHDDRLWLAVGNWTATPQTVTAQLNMAALCPKLKLATAVTKNVWKDGAVQRTGDAWSFTVPPKAARLIEIDNG